MERELSDCKAIDYKPVWMLRSFCLKTFLFFFARSHSLCNLTFSSEVWHVARRARKNYAAQVVHLEVVMSHRSIKRQKFLNVALIRHDKRQMTIKLMLGNIKRINFSFRHWLLIFSRSKNFPPAFEDSLRRCYIVTRLKIELFIHPWLTIKTYVVQSH